MATGPPASFNRISRLCSFGRVTLIGLFLLGVGRFWHPYYGLTRFLQADPTSQQTMLPTLRAAPLFIYPGPGNYDGFFYAQLATDPGLGNPHFATAIDDLGYRARRILLSALAWILGGGDTVRAVRTYAWLNVGAWLLFAALLHRLLPVSDWRANLAWLGLLAGAGTLLSVRLALTDLPAVLLLAASLSAVEKGRLLRAGSWLGAASLTRETALLAIVALLPRDLRTHPRWRRTLVAGALTVLPLAAWLGWVWWRVGPSGGGTNNLVFPGLGWGEKLRALLVAQTTAPDRTLALTALLGHMALAVQAAYLIRRRDWHCPWWRVGAASVALGLCLGPAVWGVDLPGASVRVLLPLTLAFNMVAVRRRAALAWLLAGNLTLAGGLHALWQIPTDPHELTAGHVPGGAYVVQTEHGWYPVESAGSTRWSWCNGDGRLQLQVWPRQDTTLAATVKLRALSARQVEIRQGERLIWSGLVGESRQTIVLGGLRLVDGRAELELRSVGPAQTSSLSDDRTLSFAVFEVALH